MAQSNQVILNEQDARLVYSGLWSVSGSEVNFSRTLFSSKETGATMTFSFNGTSVAVVGTYDIGGTCTVTFALDGEQNTVTSQKLTAPENHKTIWSSKTLPDGEHTLIYSVQSCTSDSSSTSGLSLWFDYVLYTPSPSSPGRVRYFVDDADPRIRYTGSWKSSNENEDFGHSKHGGIKGDSLTYEFYGTQISVHGRIPNSPGGATQATFVVDGGKTTTFSAPNQKVVTYNREFFTSGTLPLGNHTLVINPQTDLEFWVDYFLVQDEIPLPTASATPTPKSNGKIQMTVITGVGIGVGCVVVGIAIAVALFCFRRKRRRSNNPIRSKPSKVDSSTNLPWPNTQHQYPPSSPGYSTLAFSTKSSTPLVANSSGYSTYAPSAVPSESLPSRHHHRTHTAPSTSYDAASSISSETRYRQRNPVVVAEEDVTYTLGGIQRHDTVGSRDFPQSVDGMSEASYESDGPPTPYSSRRRSRSHGSNRDGPRHGRSRSRTYNAPSVASTAPSTRSRLRNATVSNPDEDPDSVAVLKRRQQEVVNNYPSSHSPSGSRSGYGQYPGPSSYVPPLPSGSGSSRPQPNYEEEDPDSVAALKRRQAEQIVLSTQGYSHQPSSSSSAGPRMHTDSGVRINPWHGNQPEPEEDLPDELPPMYTPR